MSKITDEKEIADLNSKLTEAIKENDSLKDDLVVVGGEGAAFHDLLLETYKLFWQTTHRCPGLGDGTRRMIMLFVENKLKPVLTLGVTDQLDRNLIDGKE